MTAPNKEVELIQVIRTYLTVRGEGTEANPTRRVTQYWSMSGELLAEEDPSDGEEPAWRRLLIDLDNAGGLGSSVHRRIREVLSLNGEPKQPQSPGSES